MLELSCQNAIWYCDIAKIALATILTANSTLCDNLDGILAISSATEWYENCPWTGLLHKFCIISVVSYDIEWNIFPQERTYGDIFVFHCLHLTLQNSWDLIVHDSSLGISTRNVWTSIRSLWLSFRVLARMLFCSTGAPDIGQVRKLAKKKYGKLNRSIWLLSGVPKGA